MKESMNTTKQSKTSLNKLIFRIVQHPISFEATVTIRWASLNLLLKTIQQPSKNDFNLHLLDKSSFLSPSSSLPFSILFYWVILE
jgi:hypothetical protein